MEGKGVLFKRFADIDVFDLELCTKDPDDLIRTVKFLEPTFGGINLEDIKAPECFYIEETLKREMDIPVFHDDQHGTAIISAAALINATELQGKKLDEIIVVFSGAGAAAISCAKHYMQFGVRRENILMVDRMGVIRKGRTDGMNKYKEPFMVETEKRTLADALENADVFIGLSQGGLVSKDMVKRMAKNPVIFALANPEPEIGYQDAVAARPDSIMATGRSDFPNQVNNVLGFPFIFRGALDVLAREINEPMKMAATLALASLARQKDIPAEVLAGYNLDKLGFGPDYIIPKPLDPRVLVEESAAVAQAAMDSGVARRPIKDMAEYRRHLEQLSKTIQMR
jgi:malate dehydrogenase (oxaloacetate-decarboxylating)(NADP+)